MLRLLLITSLVFTLLFSGALASLRLQPQPTREAQGSLGGCSMPCWQGVQPGGTSREAAIARLNTLIGFPPAMTGCANPSLLSCDLYAWTMLDRPFAGLFIERGEVTSVVGFAPGFTLGEALLMLRDTQLSFDGAEAHPI